ncbi:MAG: sigma-E processing peptidase SpoIIGA [Enterocloster sp.]
MSSQPVHVAAAGVMKQLCPSVKGVVYVPYQSVGTSRGVLPAVFIDRIGGGAGGLAGTALEKPLIAITKQELVSPQGEYQILIQKTD